ncbi:hypothetical protein NON00_21195 [Roseomonas sp. GC11]|uniref:hypothetical protein n=1 Tax=Roseomonas sp. GC11 TaxID=2950546 RepID=UPI0021090747|nr:hypothetical protein [Roseomonas sp. GC11]MCQ4162432.1 hypothetical protein [Roseomonas sp. GC11]
MTHTPTPSMPDPKSTPQPDQHGTPPAGAARRRQEKTLDKALEDSFPASDPSATTGPGGSTGWEEPAADDPRRDDVRREQAPGETLGKTLEETAPRP